jgi:hypothetical protein
MTSRFIEMGYYIITYPDRRRTLIPLTIVFMSMELMHMLYEFMIVTILIITLLLLSVLFRLNQKDQ